MFRDKPFSFNLYFPDILDLSWDAWVIAKKKSSYALWSVAPPCTEMYPAKDCNWRETLKVHLWFLLNIVSWSKIRILHLSKAWVIGDRLIVDRDRYLVKRSQDDHDRKIQRSRSKKMPSFQWSLSKQYFYQFFKNLHINC